MLDILPKQILTNETCLSCKGCCRFKEGNSPYAPVFIEEEINTGYSALSFEELREGGFKAKLVRADNCYICPFFDLSGNICKIYAHRPLDCRLYPFMLVASKEGNLSLAVDMNCPFARGHLNDGLFKSHISYLSGFIEQAELSYLISATGGLFMDYDALSPGGNISILRELDKLGSIANFTKKLERRTQGVPAGFSPLRLNDKNLLDSVNGGLAGGSFPSVYLWKDLFGLYYREIDGDICVFSEEGGRFFMPAPPAGAEVRKGVIEKCFHIMDELNNGNSASRIENAGQDIKDFLKGAFKFLLKEHEYEYLTHNLATLHGNAYKKKRSSINTFTEGNSEAAYRDFCKTDMRGCLDLYARWQAERGARYDDDAYRSMLRACYFAHRRAMLDFEALGLYGKVVEVDGKISAYSFGYPLSGDRFCIVLETADLTIKGLAQFIFREFCNEVGSFEYINAGDDSGLENLKRVKTSYRPARIIPSYTIYPL